MAKISARGCHAVEAWNVTLPRDADDLEDGTTRVWRYVLRSDGVVLRGMSVKGGKYPFTGSLSVTQLSPTNLYDLLVKRYGASAVAEGRK